MNRAALNDRLLALGSPLALFLLWELAAKAGWIDTRFFPAPSAILARMWVLSASGELWVNLQASLWRLLAGFIVGGIPALVLGIAAGLSRPVRIAIDPLVSATYPIPKSAVFPLILLIFGLGEASKIVMVAMGVFYPVLINAQAGVANIDRIYMDVAKNFRADRWQLFRTVAVPGALPPILAGVKLGLGMGLILIAIAEMIGADSGIGFMIWNAWQILSVETMYVGLVVIALIGFALSLATDELEKFLVPWKRARG